MVGRQVLAVAIVGALACGRSPRGGSAPPDPQQPGTTLVLPRSSLIGMASAVPDAVPSSQSALRPTGGSRLDLSPYAWHADEPRGVLVAVEHLEDRIAPPQGFERAQVEAGSFGAWLRRLPLAARDTPVRAYSGRVILASADPRLSAVVTLDVGDADLQQCADAVMRLHAEWKWSRGDRDMAYRAASGTMLPYARWSRGERLVAKGASVSWVPSGPPGGDSHASFRKFMDAVFAWSNTVALSRQATAVTFQEARPGDFFILPGSPGHTVLLLDLAVDPNGRRMALLGQSYMPAQSFHVLRAARDGAWFALEQSEGGVQTPFWPAPFPWTSLRRLDGGR
jgi:hypothetical protein